MGDRLSAEDIDLIKRWIDEGAKYDTHWAFEAPVRPELPAVKNTAWVRNEIDRFVLARLEQEGLASLARGRSLHADPPRVVRSDRTAADS